MGYNDRHWRAFLTAIGDAEKFEEDPRFSSHPARHANLGEVYRYLGEGLATRTTAEWLALFREQDIPAAPMYSIEDILGNEHLAATGFFSRRQHPTEGIITGMAIAAEWSLSKPDVLGPAPALGENTQEVLRTHFKMP